MNISCLKLFGIIDIIYDAFDTVTDVQLTVYLYENNHWIWGSVCMISSVAGIFVFLSKIPFFPYLYSLKQSVLSTATKKGMAFKMRIRYIWYYLAMYKWAEGIPVAVVRVVMDAEDIMEAEDESEIFFVAGTITTIIDTASAFFVTGFLFLTISHDMIKARKGKGICGPRDILNDLIKACFCRVDNCGFQDVSRDVMKSRISHCDNCNLSNGGLLILLVVLNLFCFVLIYYLFKLIFPPMLIIPLKRKIAMYLGVGYVYFMFFLTLINAVNETRSNKKIQMDPNDAGQSQVNETKQ